MTTPAAPKPTPDQKTQAAQTPTSKEVKSARSHAPILLELTYTLCVLLVLGAGVSTAVLSLLAGADLLMVVVRSGGALLSTGFILWVVYWVMATGIIEARRQQVIEEAAKHKVAAERAQSTLEFEA